VELPSDRGLVPLDVGMKKSGQGVKLVNALIKVGAGFGLRLAGARYRGFAGLHFSHSSRPKICRLP
jgi:hypothetical protein